MPDNQDIALRIRVLDAQGRFRGGTVDVELKHRTLSDRVVRRGLDASGEITFSGLRRAPTGDYQITVTPTDVFKPQSQFVNIPASGSATMTVTIDRARDPQQPPAPFEVRGTVRTAEGAPLAGVLVRAVHEAAPPIALGEARTDDKGGYAIKYSPKAAPAPISLRVSVVGEDSRPSHSSPVIRDPKPLEVVDLNMPPAGQRPPAHVVEGRVIMEYGLPADRLNLRFYNRGFGGADARLGEATTDAQGLYSFAYDPGGRPTHLEVRAAGADGKEVAISEVRFNAGPREVMNLVAPSSLRPLAPEYQRLVADLGRQLGGIDKLAGAEEKDGRRDLTLLHETTGWDARIIALAALASRLSAQTGIQHEALYALLRVGLPSDGGQLARVGADAVSEALTRAREAGIVGLDQAQAAKARAAFENFARTSSRTSAAPGSLSSPEQMLAKTALTDAEKNTFLDLYLRHGGQPADLWQKAGEKGIAPEKIDALRLQGKLAYLTLNNAPLADALRKEVGTADKLPLLVEKDLYSGEAWKARLRAAAGGDEQALKRLIPPAYGELKTADALEAYSEDLARKVRLSYPTRIVARLLDKGELALGKGADAAQKNVSAVLRNADGLGFQLGRASAGSFLREHGAKLFEGVAEGERPAAAEGFKLLHRLYQITPSDGALKTLLDLKFTSAQDVANLPPEVFERLYAGSFPSLEEAKLVHGKAQQVVAVAQNLLASSKQLDNPPLYAMSAPPERREEAKVNLIKHYPALESVFGSLDYCECDHCRSVLSPAAYFVELLRFLEPPPSEWNAFLQGWSEKHSGENYTARYKKPYDALVERRPDLPHILLTCENTNTALPQIDLVNEVLEYYVAKGALDGGAARDTGAATTAELLAEPQNIEPLAYDSLKGARYPLTLPFDLWLETLRRFLEHFDTPLHHVLEVLRTTDELFPPDGGSAPYYRADVFAEYLGISLDEYDVFTDPDAHTDWHELYGYASAEEAFEGLRTAKALSRRLGVTYKELADLVRTAFVNPKLEMLVVLQKLGIEARDVFRFKNHPGYVPFTAAERADFTRRLDQLTARYRLPDFNARTWLDGAWTEGAFTRILILAIPEKGCDFGRTFVHFADEDRVDAETLLRLNLFVRLWRKLGWTMEEVDRALAAFMPSGVSTGDALETALVYLAHLKELDELTETGDGARLRLLALWKDLATTGASPLYARLFLTPSVLREPFVFDHPLGRYLSNDRVPIKQHLTALQGALGLSAEEVGLILGDALPASRDPALTLANVSTLYRYRLLAKALKLSARELITLKTLSGLNPFRPLAAGRLTGLDHDHPYTGTLAFVRAARAVEESGFAVEELDYLLRHRFDPVGPFRPDERTFLSLVRALAAGLRRVEAEHATPADPSALTDEALRQKLGLVLVPEGVETFFSIWSNTAALSRPEVQARARSFFDAHLLGFLAAADFARLFGPPPAAPADAAAAQARERERRQRLADAFLPFLRRELGRRLVVQTVTAALRADAALAEALLTDPALLAEEGGGRLLDAFASVGQTAPPAGPGVTTFEGYFEVSASGQYRLLVRLAKSGARADLRLSHLPEPLLSVTAARDGEEASADTELKAGVPYSFTLDAQSLGGGGLELLIKGVSTAPESFTPLTLYPAASVRRARRALTLLSKALRVIEGFGLSEREVRHLLTHADDFGGLSLSLLPVESAAAGDAAARAREDAHAARLFAHFLRLAAYARLKRELAGGTDALVGVFERARRLLPAAADAAAARDNLLKDLYARVAELARRTPESVGEAARHLGDGATSAAAGGALRVEAPGFARERGLARLWEVLRLMTKVGVRLDELVGWATVEPDITMARSLRNTVKALHEADGWKQTARPIFDALRRRQRDALVAYVVHNHPEGFESSDQLFEYFLIDTGAEPVVQTSRLRAAISSVQLFVQRCLMNLEPFVHPTAVNTEHWKWMKRYRVWEANRKIFLFPENWLEPEFRDDKSHLFRELEGTLLQEEVTPDLAEDAFFAYLQGLEQVARLEIVTMYAEGEQGDPSAVLHVIGRTYGQPHKYFYRRYAHQSWTPWEPVTAEIDGEHVAAIVWRDRLHLFWVTFLVKSESRDSGETTLAGMADAKLKDIRPLQKVKLQLNWSEYHQGEWTPRQSGGFSQEMAVAEDFDPARLLIHVAKSYEDDEERGVTIYLSGAGDIFGLHLAGKNSKPWAWRFRAGIVFLRMPYEFTHARETYFDGSGPLQVTYAPSTSDDDTSDVPPRDILRRSSSAYRLLFNSERPDTNDEALSAPFFYQDTQHTFFVEPTMTLVPLPSWGGWVITDPGLVAGTNVGNWIFEIPIQVEVPRVIIFEPEDPDWGGRLPSRPTGEDWITNPATAFVFDGQLIGRTGGLSLPAGNVAAGAGAANLQTQVGLTLNATAGAFAAGTDGLGGRPLNVVGGAGLVPSTLAKMTPGGPN